MGPGPSFQTDGSGSGPDSIFLGLFGFEHKFLTSSLNKAVRNINVVEICWNVNRFIVVKSLRPLTSEEIQAVLSERLEALLVFLRSAGWKLVLTGFPDRTAEKLLSLWPLHTASSTPWNQNYKKHIHFIRSSSERQKCHLNRESTSKKSFSVCLSVPESSCSRVGTVRWFRNYQGGVCRADWLLALVSPPLVPGTHWRKHVLLY